MKIAIQSVLATLLVAAAASPQLLAQAAADTQTGAMATNSSPDLAMRESLVMVQAMAQKSDLDIARLRIDKWKANGQVKQQSEANAASIRRNLTAAIPDLIVRIQGEPSSLMANFRLYRNLNALYDSFSALAESASAFGTDEQYTTLSSDVTQLDKLRHDFAQRVDTLAGASDAEMARLRAAAAVARSTSSKPATIKPGSKIVVDDTHPAPRKKPKHSVAKPATAKPPAAAEPTDPPSAEPTANDSQTPPKKKQKPSPYPSQAQQQ